VFDGESAFGREERVRCGDRTRIVFGRWGFARPADSRHRYRSDGDTDGRTDVDPDHRADGEADGNADCDPDREAIDRTDRHPNRNARADRDADERPDDQCMREAIARGTLDSLLRIGRCARADRLRG